MKRIFILNVLLLTCLATTVRADDVDLGRIVVTPGRLEKEQYRSTGNITVIGREYINDSNAQTIPEVLEEAVGVLVYNKSTSKTSTVDMRGFGDTASRNVLVLVNGRKINSVDISGSDLLQVPIGAVERIEILRGGGSVLYGDNAVGGVINIITKKGKGPVSATVGGYYGSFDQQGTDLEVEGSQNHLSYYFYSKYMDDRGYRQNSNVLAKDFNTQLSYDGLGFVDVDLNLGWHKDEYGLPGGLSLSEIETLGREGSADPHDFAQTRDQFAHLTFDIKPWDAEEYGKFVVNYHFRDRDVFDSFRSFGTFNTRRSLLTNGIAGKYIFDRVVFDKEVNIVTGIDFYDYENEISGSGSNSDDLTISKTEFGAYTYLDFELFENLFVNGGTRYQNADYTFNQRASSVTYVERDPQESVNMFGMKYEYAKGSNVHLNVQQTFRFLSTDEWYSTFSGLNTDLKQQTGVQYEAGVKHNFRNGVVVSLAPYWMDLKNEIFLNPDKGSFGTNDNYEKTRRVGVELGSTVDLKKFVDCNFFDRLEFFTNYTYQRPQFNGGANDDKDIPMAPRHQASNGLLAKFWDHYQVSVIGKYVGSRYAINDTTNATGVHKGYYVFDTKLNYIHNNLEIFFAINNVFDEKYTPLIVKSASGPAKDFFPAPERNYNMGVKVKF